MGSQARPFSLSHSYFLSPSLGENPDMTEILFVGILMPLLKKRAQW